MKPRCNNRENGSALFVALSICMVVGIILAGYLFLTSNRFQMTVRSADWNAAIPVLEAGVEEAMTHIARDTNQPTANNWTSATIQSVQAYTKTRTFSDGSYYYVYIRDLTTRGATIYSSGFVRSPYNTNQYISRLVKVGVTNPPSVFTHALAVNGAVTLVGGPLVDGFDSRKGLYNVSTNRDAAGGIVTNSKTNGAVSLGGANVYGQVITGPGGTISGGTVGDIAWNTSHSGIEPGWTNNNMNVAYPSNSPPTGGPYVPPTQYTNMTSGTYQIAGSFSSSGDITVSGNVTLYLTAGNTFSLGGNDTIRIVPGGSLTIIAGGNLTIGGGGVYNVAGYAARFSIVGLPTCTSISYSGGAQFIGTINAPQADFNLKGNSDAYGAIIANSATMNGNTAIHYDEALAFPYAYIVNSWQEM
jgi:hypothetical protein